MLYKLMLKLMRERTWQQICNGKLKSQFMHFLQFVYVSQKDYTYNNNEVLIWKCDESLERIKWHRPKRRKNFRKKKSITG